MVSVSLLQLVALANSRPLWPTEFEALIAKLADDPRVKAQWGVIADWCRENEEIELADAFAWIGKNTFKVQCYGRDENRCLDFVGLPDHIFQFSYPHDCDRKTLAGLTAGLAYRLGKARALAKKQLEELE